MRTKKSRVAIVKVDETNIEESFEQLMDLLGGMNHFVQPFQNILIKPNWVNDDDYQKGTVTHPELIRACVNKSMKLGAKKVLVGDSSYVGLSTSKAIEKSGLRDLSSKRIELVDFKKMPYVPVVIPNASKFRRLSFPEVVLESDIIINMPVMKTHDCLPVTLGFKNMKGLITDKNKKKFHNGFLEEGIIDINRVALADLTIIDGIIGMEGDGPVHGSPVHHKIIIASQDPLAAEVVAIQAMGFDPETMDYIHMAYEAGFGQKDLSCIEIIGEELDSIKKKYKSTYLEGRAYNNDKVKIRDCYACSACRSMLNAYLYQEKKRLIQDDVKIKFYCGNFSEKINTDKDEIIIGVGKCLTHYEKEFDGYAGGCPPHTKKIKETVNYCLQHKK